MLWCSPALQADTFRVFQRVGAGWGTIMHEKHLHRNTTAGRASSTSSYGGAVDGGGGRGSGYPAVGDIRIVAAGAPVVPLGSVV